MSKSFLRVSFILLLMLIYSCGGGSSSSSSLSNSNNTGGKIQLAGVAGASANPIAEDVSVSASGLDNTTVGYTEGFSEIVNSECAYTYTDGGLLVCIPIDNNSKVELTANDVLDNGTVDDIIDEEIEDNNKPFIFGINNLEKPAKKPICDKDKNLCALLDFTGNYPDMTVALVPYKSLIAIPNQGKEVLQSGYVPITNYSADLAVFNAFGKRYGIDEIAKVLQDKGVSLKVYFVLPYKENLASTFTSDNYKLFKVAINNGVPSIVDTGKNIKVVAKGTDNVTFEAILDGFYPFILAREMNASLKQVDNGSISGLRTAAITLLACDNDSTVDNLKNCVATGYDTIDAEGNYSLIYEKPSDKALFAEVVSTYLKDKKKVLPYDELNGYSFAEIVNSSYPSLDNLTDADKALLKDMLSDIDDDSSMVKSALYPQYFPLVHDNMSVQTMVSEAIAAFINQETYSPSSGKYSGYNEKACQYSFEGDNKTFSFKKQCENSSAGATTSSVSKSSDSYTLKEEVTFTMQRDENGIISCSYNKNYESNSIYKDENTGKILSSYISKEKESQSWNLDINSTRTVENLTGFELSSWSSESSEMETASTGKYSETEEYNYSLLRNGNSYYYIEQGTYSKVESGFSYSDKYIYSAKYNYNPTNKSVTKEANSEKVKIESIKYTCSAPHNIKETDIFNILKTGESSFLVNGSEFDTTNVPYLYSVCNPSTQ